MRLLCVHLPMWPINRLQRRLQREAPPEHPGQQQAQHRRPLLLVCARANLQHIACCCRAAARCGVRPGITLAQARAMISGANGGGGAGGQEKGMHVEAFDPAADRAALLRLAHWAALRYSPIVSIDPCTLNDKLAADDPLPDGLVMNITGCDRLFDQPGGRGGQHGEERLAQSILQSLSRAGFEASIGIGPTIGAAWAAARFGSSNRAGQARVSLLPSEPRALREQLSSMPVRALRIEPKARQALLELGLETIGQVLALPRASLPSRFGPLLLRRIDQAFGSAIEVIEPVRPAPPLRLERIFDGPTPQLEAIESCTRELLVELCRQLLYRESGVRLLHAVFWRIGRNGRGTEPLTHRITLSHPSREAPHLWLLLRPRIEKLHLGYGIESITLTAQRTARLPHRQSEYVEKHRPRMGPEARQHEGELIDTLANRLGADRVLRAARLDSHIPERAARFTSADGGHGQAALSLPVRHGPRKTVTPAAPRLTPIPTLSSRPTILLEAPEPAQAIALTPDRPPMLLRWRGEDRRITAAVGPERLAGEWWRVPATGPTRDPPPARDAWERDYFRLCDDVGRWMWVFREMPLFGAQDVPEKPAATQWFVHGIWA